MAAITPKTLHKALSAPKAMIDAAGEDKLSTTARITTYLTLGLSFIITFMIKHFSQPGDKIKGFIDVLPNIHTVLSEAKNVNGDKITASLTLDDGTKVTFKEEAVPDDNTKVTVIFTRNQQTTTEEIKNMSFDGLIKKINKDIYENLKSYQYYNDDETNDFLEKCYDAHVEAEKLPKIDHNSSVQSIKLSGFLTTGLRAGNGGNIECINYLPKIHSALSKATEAFGYKETTNFMLDRETIAFFREAIQHDGKTKITMTLTKGTETATEELLDISFDDLIKKINRDIDEKLGLYQQHTNDKMQDFLERCSNQHQNQLLQIRQLNALR